MARNADPFGCAITSAFDLDWGLENLDVKRSAKSAVLDDSELRHQSWFSNPPHLLLWLISVDPSVAWREFAIDLPVVEELAGKARNLVGRLAKKIRYLLTRQSIRELPYGIVHLV